MAASAISVDCVESMLGDHCHQRAGLALRLDDLIGLRHVISAGFSMITCLPASRASMATSPCRPVGVQTDDNVDFNGLQCIRQ